MVLIKGMQKTSLLDFEPYTACVVFLGNCNFKCDYCHNPDLVIDFNNTDTINEDEFFSFLDERKKWLDGVCVSGGEPTIYKDLPLFISKIKEKGFLVKLDTNGGNPSMIKELIDNNMLDYIAMDIKTSLDEYEKVTCVKTDMDKIKESIELIKNSGIKSEFRTTVIPEIVTKDNILKISKMLNKSSKYVLQNFNPKQDMINNEFKKKIPMKKSELEEIKENIKDYFDDVVVRS